MAGRKLLAVSAPLSPRARTGSGPRGPSGRPVEKAREDLWAAVRHGKAATRDEAAEGADDETPTEAMLRVEALAEQLNRAGTCHPDIPWEETTGQTWGSSVGRPDTSAMEGKNGNNCATPRTGKARVFFRRIFGVKRSRFDSQTKMTRPSHPMLTFPLSPPSPGVPIPTLHNR